jgi:hypothetical protein
VTYLVRWKESALNELASAWMQANSAQRQAISAASQRLDAELSTDPEQKGESRPQGRRIHFAPPLGVTFQVQFRLSTVFVLHAWRYQ